MKRAGFYLVAVFIFINSNSIYAKQNFINYSFARNDSNSLAIVLSFNGNSSGRSYINLPDEWAGQTQLYNAVTNLTATSPGTKITATEKPSRFLVEYNKGATVNIKYILRKDWRGALMYPYYFKPVIEKDYFYFEGYSGLVYPDIKGDEKITCELDFQHFGKDEFIGNSYFFGIPNKKFTTTTDDLLNSIFCGGNYRFKEVEINNSKIVIAVTGSFLFKDEEVFSKLSRIIGAERKFWNESKFPYFFTALLAMGDQDNSGGTAHYNSFSLFQSTNLQLDQGLTYLMAHEYFHNWIGQGIKMPEPEEIYKWFQEGFTDYYSYKILRYQNLLDEKEYLGKINQIMKDYYLSAYFNIANTELVGNYWKNGAFKQLSYQRGLILAFLINNYISHKSKFSLDDFIRDLYISSKPRYMFSKELFDKMILKYADKDLLAIIDSVNNGINTSLAPALKSNRRYDIKDLLVDSRFDLGFDFEKSRSAKKIIGLKDSSNASLAGLKEGMELTGNFSIYNNNIEKPARIQVMIDGQKKWIEFIPGEKIHILIPQINLSK